MKTKNQIKTIEPTPSEIAVTPRDPDPHRPLDPIQVPVAGHAPR